MAGLTLWQNAGDRQAVNLLEDVGGEGNDR